MKYYKMVYDYNNDEGVISCTARELHGIDRYDVEKGIKVVNWDNRNSFHYDPSSGDRFTDYLANDLAWFIITPKFKEVLENCKVEGLQYLPINIINEADGSNLEEHYVANICNLVDALDLEHSKCNEFSVGEGRGGFSVKVYALKKSRLAKAKIFRLKGSNFAIFVSEDIKKSIEKNNITGCDFLEVKLF